MSAHSQSLASVLRPSGWRYYLGWFFFVLSFLLPFFAPLISLLSMSKTMKAMLIGSLLVGVPELIMVIAIALWGKKTFDYFMSYIYRFFKRFVPKAHVSPARYYIGLVLLISSFFPTWILAYFPTIVSDSLRIAILVFFDVMFVSSFFVLGGDFWEKVRALFTPRAITIHKK